MLWNAFRNWGLLTVLGRTGKRVFTLFLPSSVRNSFDNFSSSRYNLCLNPFCTAPACCGPTPLIFWTLFSLNRSSVSFVIVDSCCDYEVAHLILHIYTVQKELFLLPHEKETSSPSSESWKSHILSFHFILQLWSRKPYQAVARYNHYHFTVISSLHHSKKSKLLVKLCGTV